MAKRKAATKTFFTHIKNVLEHWSDLAWLGTNSPLATPYFLGEQLHGTEVTPEARGAVLLAEVERTLEALWRGPLPDDATTVMDAIEAEEDEQGRGDRYDCLILELNYLKRIGQPPRVKPKFTTTSCIFRVPRMIAIWHRPWNGWEACCCSGCAQPFAPNSPS